MEELLTKIKRYIERVEEQIDGEWGLSRGLDKLISDEEMPDIYWKVCESLDKLSK